MADTKIKIKKIQIIVKSIHSSFYSESKSVLRHKNVLCETNSHE